MMQRHACQWNAADGATRRWLLKQPLPSPVMGSHGLVAHSPFTRYLYCARSASARLHVKQSPFLTA